MVGIAAEGMAARALVGTVIGFRGAIVAILLEAVAAVAAFAARIDEDSDAHHVARLEFARPAADRLDAPDNLVTGHARIERTAPDIARAVEIRVADPAILDLDPYVARTRFPALEGDRPQRRLGGGRGITEALEHGIAPVSDIASRMERGRGAPPRCLRGAALPPSRRSGRRLGQKAALDELLDIGLAA